MNATGLPGAKKQGRKPARDSRTPPPNQTKKGGKPQPDRVKKDSRLDMEKPPKPQK